MFCKKLCLCVGGGLVHRAVLGHMVSLFLDQSDLQHFAPILDLNNSIALDRAPTSWGYFTSKNHVLDPPGVTLRVRGDPKHFFSVKFAICDSSRSK